MAIKHTIRNNRGGTKTVNLTRASAIYTFCYECMGWNHYEVEKCTDKLCPLYPFRNRGTTKGMGKVNEKSIQALKKSVRERSGSTKTSNRKV